MLWLKGVKNTQGIVAIMFLGSMVALAGSQYEWAILFSSVGIAVGYIAQRRIRQLCEYEKPYKNVTFLCVHESPTVWSTHIGGFVERPFVQILWRIKKLFRREPGLPSGMKLVLHRDDRLEVRRRSLACFARKLDTLAAVPSAKLLTASVLNDSGRPSKRLEDRVQEIKARPQWRYQFIERKLGVCEALIGRLCFGWKFPNGSGFWRPHAAGLIAWRAQDEKPSLEKLDAQAAYYILDEE